MAASVTLNGRPGEDAAEIADLCGRRPEPWPTDWLAEANRFFCPAGSVGRGGALLRESQLARVALRGKVELYLADGMGGSVTLPNLRAVGNPRCLTPGVDDPVYLVRLADRRLDILGATAERYQWRYNPTDRAAVATTTGATSWADVIAALYPAELGDFPGLPAEVPTATAAVVERLDAHAFRKLDALEDALAAVGCGLAYDPVDDGSSIVYFPRAADRALAVMDRYAGSLEYDESPYTPAGDAGAYPSVVVVLFPAWLPGRSDREPRLVYAAAVAAPSSGVSLAAGLARTAGVVYLQDFTPARCYPNGDLANATLLGQRATQVATIWFDRFRAASPQWPIARAYKGVIDDPDVRPGGSFDVVGWTLVPKPLTYVARSGLTGAAELYETPELSGLQPAPAPTPLADADGVPIRAGGYPPELDREREAWGHASHPDGAVSVAGAGLGPFLRRGSALRQGEWHSIGTGGRVVADRPRLWRNWDDPGGQPDDMVRHIFVTGDPVDVSIDGTTRTVYPARPARQEGWPTDWALEEDCYLFGANREPLERREYLAHAGTRADDGLRLWATFCCSGGVSGDGPSPVSGPGGGGSDLPPPYSSPGGFCQSCTDFSGAISAYDYLGNLDFIKPSKRLRVTIRPRYQGNTLPACGDAVFVPDPCANVIAANSSQVDFAPVTFFTDFDGAFGGWPISVIINPSSATLCPGVAKATMLGDCSPATFTLYSPGYVSVQVTIKCARCCAPCNPFSCARPGNPLLNGFYTNNGMGLVGPVTTNAAGTPCVAAASLDTNCALGGLTACKVFSFNPVVLTIVTAHILIDVVGQPCR